MTFPAASPPDHRLDRRRLTYRQPATEARYREVTRPRNLAEARLALLLAIVVNLPFALLDVMVAGPFLPYFLAMRILGVTAVFALLWHLSRLPRNTQRWPLFLILGHLFYAGYVCALALLGDANPLQRAGFVLVVMGGAALFPYRFLHGVATNAVASLSYLLTLTFDANIDATDFGLLCGQIAAANAMGAILLYRRDLNRRRDFEATEALQAERQRYYDLLTRILPAAIADRLQKGENPIADPVPEATVLFADIVDFTNMAANSPPREVLALLNETFAAFDRLVETHGLAKIKTIGDAYMVAGGLPHGGNGKLDAVAQLALGMLAATGARQRPDGTPLAVRIGIHCGPLTAGVIGDKRFLYDLWGDTVNMAARLESLGEPGRIHVSEAVRRGLAEGFRFEARGEIEVKGKGRLNTWYLLGAG